MMIKTTIRFLNWLPLASGLWKLNVDEASKGSLGLARGGGRLCENRCHILFAFSYFYDIQTNTSTKAMEIWDGMLLFEDHHFHDIVLESDSHELVEMLCAISCLHWRLKNV